MSDIKYKAAPDGRTSIVDGNGRILAVVTGDTKAAALASRDRILMALNLHKELVHHLGKTTAALQIACANLGLKATRDMASELYNIRIEAELALAKAIDAEGPTHG